MIRRFKWRWLGFVLLAGTGIYGLALVVVPEGECGRDSPFFFGAAHGESFLHFMPFTEESGTATPEGAAADFADNLFGHRDFSLVADTAGSDIFYQMRDVEGRLLGRLSVSNTGFGRFFVGGYSTCCQRSHEFVGSPAPG